MVISWLRIGIKSSTTLQQLKIREQVMRQFSLRCWRWWSWCTVNSASGGTRKKKLDLLGKSNEDLRRENLDSTILLLEHNFRTQSLRFSLKKVSWTQTVYPGILSVFQFFVDCWKFFLTPSTSQRYALRWPGNRVRLSVIVAGICLKSCELNSQGETKVVLMELTTFGTCHNYSLQL